MKTITLSKQAAKALRRMPANDAATIRAKIEQLATAPEGLANQIKRLKGRPDCRLRVGDWRIIFNDAGEVLAILAIGARGSVYD